MTAAPSTVARTDVPTVPATPITVTTTLATDRGQQKPNDGQSTFASAVGAFAKWEGTAVCRKYPDIANWLATRPKA